MFLSQTSPTGFVLCFFFLLEAVINHRVIYHTTLLSFFYQLPDSLSCTVLLTAGLLAHEIKSQVPMLISCMLSLPPQRRLCFRLLLLFCLFDSRNMEKVLAHFYEISWKGLARPKEVPVQFWSGSKSRGRYKQYALLVEMALAQVWALWVPFQLLTMQSYWKGHWILEM